MKTGTTPNHRSLDGVKKDSKHFSQYAQSTLDSHKFLRRTPLKPTTRTIDLDESQDTLSPTQPFDIEEQTRMAANIAIDKDNQEHYELRSAEQYQEWLDDKTRGQSAAVQQALAHLRDIQVKEQQHLALIHEQVRIEIQERQQQDLLEQQATQQEITQQLQADNEELDPDEDFREAMRDMLQTQVEEQASTQQDIILTHLQQQQDTLATQRKEHEALMSQHEEAASALQRSMISQAHTVPIPHMEEYATDEEQPLACAGKATKPRKRIMVKSAEPYNARHPFGVDPRRSPNKSPQYETVAL
jgi:hypothetical protein